MQEMERPRERLAVEGADALSADELLSVVLGTGMAGESALDTARRVIRTRGGLRPLSRARVSELLAVPGLGPARAARVVAAFCLGRRVISALPEPRPVVRGPDDVASFMGPRLVGLGHEAFWVVALTVKNEVLDLLEVGRGTLTGVDVHPREVFRFLTLAQAAAAVVVHNHPSGDPSPSPEDIELTQRLVLAGQLLGIPLLDHVIVAASGHLSIIDGCRSV